MSSSASRSSNSVERDADRVAGAALHALLDELDRHLGDELLLERLGDPFGAVADDDDDAFERQLGERVDDVQHHRAPAQRVQHLGRAGAHPGALAGGEDDGGEGSVLAHVRAMVLGLTLVNTRGARSVARGRGFEPRLGTPKDPVLPLHHPRSVPTIAVGLHGDRADWEHGAAIRYRAHRHGLPDQEAPQAHAQEEAQEASEEDPLATSSAGQVSSDRPVRGGRFASGRVRTRRASVVDRARVHARSTPNAAARARAAAAAASASANHAAYAEPLPQSNAGRSDGVLERARGTRAGAARRASAAGSRSLTNGPG